MVVVKAALARAVLGMEVALVEAESAAEARVKVRAAMGAAGRWEARVKVEGAVAVAKGKYCAAQNAMPSKAL